MFIHKMSYDVRKRLIDVLDAGDFWRELGGRRLNYTYEELNRFRQVGSTKLPIVPKTSKPHYISLYLHS